ncbi:hypothetical protein B0H14DRAFT_1075334 [Mycena olivaceomarginata]|nr:hypothetical protein B0H14DRAFT_1075334 [Mycena olivaceomarginata]
MSSTTCTTTSSRSACPLRRAIAIALPLLGFSVDCFQSRSCDSVHLTFILFVGCFSPERGMCMPGIPPIPAVRFAEGPITLKACVSSLPQRDRLYTIHGPTILLGALYPSLLDLDTKMYLCNYSPRRPQVLTTRRIWLPGCRRRCFQEWLVNYSAPVRPRNRPRAVLGRESLSTARHSSYGPRPHVNRLRALSTRTQGLWAEM